MLFRECKNRDNKAQIKNPVIFKLQGFSLPGGAGGIRTRVQTSSKTAFYMLI